MSVCKGAVFKKEVVAAYIYATVLLSHNHNITDSIWHVLPSEVQVLQRKPYKGEGSREKGETYTDTRLAMKCQAMILITRTINRSWTAGDVLQTLL